MKNGKIASTIRIDKETHNKMNLLWPASGCRSQNEFVEKAIQFYAGYLTSQNAAEFLGEVLTAKMAAIVEESEKRINRNLFRLAVEVGLTGRVISTYEAIEQINLTKLRGEVVNDVKRTRGVQKLEDAVRNREHNFETAHGEGNYFE